MNCSGRPAKHAMNLLGLTIKSRRRLSGFGSGRVPEISPARRSASSLPIRSPKMIASSRGIAIVAVGTRVSSRAPRTEPYVRLSRIRLPPRVCDGEAIARPRVEDDRSRKPVPTNARALNVFRHHVIDLWRRTLLSRPFEPKRYLPLSKIADGVRGAEVSEIVDAHEKTVKTRMFCAGKRLSELLASKNIYTACSWDACRSLDWKLIWTLNKGDDYAFVCTRCYRRHHIRGDYDFRDF